MGLLGKAIARSAAPSEIQAAIVDFHQLNPSFHCIVLQGAAQDVNAMVGSYGVVCALLPDGNSLILLPGGLDIELFAHRLSKSTGLPELSQFSSNSPSFAIEKLKPSLQ